MQFNYTPDTPKLYFTTQQSFTTQHSIDETYECISKIVQGKKNSQEKIQEIMNIFSQVFERSLTLEERLRELEEDFIDYQETENVIEHLLPKVHLLVQENQELKDNLEQVIREHQKLLEERDIVLVQLSKGKEDFFKKQEQIEKQIFELEEAKRDILNRDEIFAIKEQKIKNKINLISEDHNSIKIGIEQCEQKQQQYSWLKIGFVATSISTVACALYANRGAISPLPAQEVLKGIGGITNSVSQYLLSNSTRNIIALGISINLSKEFTNIIYHKTKNKKQAS